MIDCFHWLGAVITSLKTIHGVPEQSRAAGPHDEAAAHVPSRWTAFPRRSQWRAGVPRASARSESWRAAVAESLRLHVVRKPPEVPPRALLLPLDVRRPLDRRQELQLYKVEPVIEDGNGNREIYAPHVDSFSVTHGKAMRRIGFYVVDYYRTQMDRPRRLHAVTRLRLTIVRQGAGTYENGGGKAADQVSNRVRIPVTTCSAPDSVTWTGLYPF